MEVKRSVVNGPYAGIIFVPEEIIRFERFKEEHTHPELRDPYKEDCCPSSGWSLKYTSCSIGWTWTIKCDCCKKEENLSQDIEW